MARYIDCDKCYHGRVCAYRHHYHDMITDCNHHIPTADVVEKEYYDAVVAGQETLQKHFAEVKHGKESEIKKNEIWRYNGGRIRAIAFHCQRCDKIVFKVITEEMARRSEDNLQCYAPPDGWGRHEHGLLCRECYERYKEFMGAK